jgi:hypothetical protein
MNKTTCSMSARDPANADPPRRGYMTANAESRSVITAITVNVSRLADCRSNSNDKEGKEGKENIYTARLSAGNPGVPCTCHAG